ncbi:hypothetical protein [Cohnella sp. JJ-181]|uniref:hypothetical protein n=1 Tax=Cohnella rhizoplanae TaxID=2974897 RepID=UPI00232C17A6|nr:hypothetical protein [Cohnella sp. JJ-181]
MKLLWLGVFVLGTFFIVKPAAVHACSCAERPGIEDQLQRKTAVFTGKVLSLSNPVSGRNWSSADPVKVQMEVNKVWKGELASQTTVYTAVSSVSCGYEDFKVNEEYIVFAYGDPDRLETGLCEGNKTLATAQDELKALGAGYEPAKKLSQKDPQGEPSMMDKIQYPLFIVAFVIVIALLTVQIKMKRRRR